MKTMEHGYLILSISIRPSGAMLTGKSLKAFFNFFSSFSYSDSIGTPFFARASSIFLYFSRLAS